MICSPLFCGGREGGLLFHFMFLHLFPPMDNVFSCRICRLLFPLARGHPQKIIALLSRSFFSPYSVTLRKSLSVSPRRASFRSSSAFTRLWGSRPLKFPYISFPFPVGGFPIPLLLQVGITPYLVFFSKVQAVPGYSHCQASSAVPFRI